MNRATVLTASLVAAATALIACSSSETSSSETTSAVPSITSVTESPPSSKTSSGTSSEATATLAEATSSTAATAAPAPEAGQPDAPEESVAQETPSPAPVAAETVSPEERCELGYITADIQNPEFDYLGYCDGQWASVSKYQTDWTARLYWDGAHWIVPEFDGEIVMGLNQGCYLPETFEETGMPPAEVGFIFCGEGDVIY